MERSNVIDILKDKEYFQVKSADDLERIIYHAIQTSYKRTPDGSHMVIDIDKEMAKAETKINAIFSRATPDMFQFKQYQLDKGLETIDDERRRAIEAYNRGIFSDDTLNGILDALYQDEVKLRDKLENAVESYKNDMLKQHKEKLKKKKNADYSEEAWSALTGGRSRSFIDKGNEITNFGYVLNTKLFKGVGEGFVGAGMLIRKAAPLLGMISIAMDFITTNTKYQTSLIEIDIKRQQALYERTVAYFNADKMAISTAMSAASQRANAIFSTYSQLGLEGMKIGSDGYVVAHEVATKSVFDILEGAFHAAERGIDLAGEDQKYQQHKDALMKAMSAQIKASNALESAGYAKAAAQKEEADAILKARQLQLAQEERKANWDYYGGLGDTFSGGLYSQLGGKAFQDSYMNSQTAEVNYEATLIEGEASAMSLYKQSAADLHASAAQHEANLAQQKASIQQQFQDTIIEAAKSMAKAWLNMTEQLTKRYQEQETLGAKMGRSIGYTGDQLLGYVDKLMKTQHDIAWFGKNLVEMSKTQMDYQSNTGRNYQYTTDDFKMTYANELLFGDATVSQINAAAEILNYTPSHISQMTHNAFRKASAQGINGVKVVKDIAKNMGYLTRYHFKNGVHSLMELEVWAEKNKFNMASLPTIIDNVYANGNIFDTIDKMAKISYLGGNFMINSDPIMAAYESVYDPAALAKRFNDMLGGIGRIVGDMGETQFTAAEELILSAYSHEMGLDVADVKASIRKRNKAEALRQYVNPNEEFSEEDLDIIGANVEFDQKDKVWKLGDKELKDISKEDVKKYSPEEMKKQKIASLKKIEKDVLGMQNITERTKAYQEEMLSRLMMDHWWNMRNASLEMINNQITEFDKNYTTKYLPNLTKNLGMIDKAQASFLGYFEKGNEKIDKVVQDLSINIGKLEGLIKKDFDRGFEQIGKALSTQINAMGWKSYIRDMSDLYKELTDKQNALDAARKREEGRQQQRQQANVGRNLNSLVERGVISRSTAQRLQNAANDDSHRGAVEVASSAMNRGQNGTNGLAEGGAPVLDNVYNTYQEIWDNLLIGIFDKNHIKVNRAMYSLEQLSGMNLHDPYEPYKGGFWVFRTHNIEYAIASAYHGLNKREAVNKPNVREILNEIKNLLTYNPLLRIHVRNEMGKMVRSGKLPQNYLDTVPFAQGGFTRQGNEARILSYPTQGGELPMEHIYDRVSVAHNKEIDKKIGETTIHSIDKILNPIDLDCVYEYHMDGEEIVGRLMEDSDCIRVLARMVRNNLEGMTNGGRAYSPFFI